MLVEPKGKSVKLPDFLIVGASKNGTTSLTECLAEHPNIYTKRKKTTFFALANKSYSYNREHTIGPFLITNFDDYCKYFGNIKNSKVLREASTTYLHPDLVYKIVKYINNGYYKNKYLNLSKIIILINSLKKAFSQYVTMIHQREKLPLVKACNEWNKKEKKNWNIAHNCIGTHLYYQSVRKYIKTFKYTKICLYGNLIETPVKTISDIYKFFHMNIGFAPENTNKRYSVPKIPKNKFYESDYNILMSYNFIKYSIKSLLSNKTINTLKKRINDRFFYESKLDKVSGEKIKENFKNALKLQSLIW